MNFIRKVKQALWFDKNGAWEGLDPGETPADPVCSFDTRDCCMSVFAVDKKEDVPRVAAAFVGETENLRHFDYVIFNSSDVDAIGFEIIESGGTTADDGINSCHRDIIHISAQKLTALTDRLILEGRYPDTCDRISEKDVAKHIIEGIKNRFIEESRVKPKVLEKAQKQVNRKK